VESRVIRRGRFACLLPVVLFIVLRALSHAHPAAPPWVLGVFDGGGLDDVLQGIRIPYAPSADAASGPGKALRITIGRMAPLEPSPVSDGFVATAQSRAPPPA
jgi:hypothetical protein